MEKQFLKECDKKNTYIYNSFFKLRKTDLLTFLSNCPRPSIQQISRVREKEEPTYDPPEV